MLTVARSNATGTPDFRIFTVASGTVVILEGLTATGGNAAASTDAPGRGGGIENSGTLTLTNFTVSGNTAISEGNLIFSRSLAGKGRN